MAVKRVTIQVTLPDALHQAVASFAQRKGLTFDRCISASAAELLISHDPQYARKRHRAPTFIEMLAAVYRPGVEYACGKCGQVRLVARRRDRGECA